MIIPKKERCTKSKRARAKWRPPRHGKFQYMSCIHRDHLSFCRSGLCFLAGFMRSGFLLFNENCYRSSNKRWWKWLYVMLSGTKLDVKEERKYKDRSHCPSIIHAVCGNRVIYLYFSIYIIQVWISIRLCLVFAGGRGIILSKVIYPLWEQSGWQPWKSKSFVHRENMGWGWSQCLFSHLIVFKVDRKTRERVKEVQDLSYTMSISLQKNYLKLWNTGVSVTVGLFL